MRVIRSIAGIAAFSLAVSTLSLTAFAQATTQPGAGGGATLRSWCGQQAADRVCVNWGSGVAVADVHGPVQPQCSPGRPGNLSSSWFHVIQ